MGSRGRSKSKMHTDENVPVMLWGYFIGIYTVLFYLKMSTYKYFVQKVLNSEMWG